MPFWDVIDKVDALMGIGAAVIGILGYLLGRYGYRLSYWLKDLFRKHAKSQGVILAVYRKDTAKQAIEKYLQADRELRCIRESACVFHQTKEWYSAGDLSSICNAVNQKLEIASTAAEKPVVHVFLDTTVVLGALLCAPLYNRMEVHLYQWSNSTYEYQGLLKK